jgi:hypothetical protein
MQRGGTENAEKDAEKKNTGPCMTLIHTIGIESFVKIRAIRGQIISYLLRVFLRALRVSASHQVSTRLNAGLWERTISLLHQRMTITDM